MHFLAWSANLLAVTDALVKKLFVDRIQLITKLKSNMKGVLVSVVDKLLLRKKIIIGSLVFLSNNLLFYLENPDLFFQ